MTGDQAELVPPDQMVSDKPSARVVHADLPASVQAPRLARVTIRSVLRAWGLGNLASDAELITSELVANAAEHAGGPIGLTISPHTEPSGQPGVLCQITDPAPDLPLPQAAEPDSEHGRGLQIVTALATSSGFTTSPHGKTAWFTLTTTRSPGRIRQADLSAEAGA